MSKYVKTINNRYFYPAYHQMANLLKLTKFIVNIFPPIDRNVFRIISVHDHYVGVEDIVTGDQFIFDIDYVEELSDIKTDEEAMVYLRLEQL